MRRIFPGLVLAALLRFLVPRWGLEPPLQVAARHPWWSLLIVGAALAFGGLVVVASGVIPVAASAGHWGVTEWILQFAKRQSVSTHAFGIETPRLDDAALVRKGAGHYEIGCRQCHGLGGDRPRVPLAMLPPPPILEQRVPEWRPRELFYIVKHGLKFTGMPAWPAQERDDEVWAMVAFLQRLPHLGPGEYDALVPPPGWTADAIESAAGVDAPPEIAVETCGRCHGADGRGRGTGAFPVLAGQQTVYLSRALEAYAEGRRHSGIMEPIAAALSDREIRDLALYYGQQGQDQNVPIPGTRSTAAVDGAAIDPGEQIARHGIREQRVPPCASCHGLDTGAVNPAYPRLAGQYADYLQLQLELLRARRRGGSAYVHLMHAFVDRLTDAQIADVAEYYESLDGMPRAEAPRRMSSLLPSHP